MEEFEEDDFSDLYADVEVQASSAISAMHRSTNLPPRRGIIVANPSRGAEIGGGHRKFDKRDAACDVTEESGGGRNFTVENYDGCESRLASESKSEDGLDSDGDDGIERIIDKVCHNEKYDDHESDEDIGGISGEVKSADGGDYGSQRKILEPNSLNSKKKRVDETILEMLRTCKKGNADAKDPFFNRSCADNQPNYGWKLGGPEIASERQTQACYPVPLDLDKHGSVQISDSVEDSPHEVSECDSEGMSGTSDDTNRRRASCIKNNLSSRIEPESFESGRSQHCRSPSRDALSSRYFEKRRKRSDYSPSSLHCELQEPITCENRPRKDSVNRAVKRGTWEGRYHKRWSGSMQEHSNLPKKSNYVPYFKNRPDEDASYAIDAKNPCNRLANHGKPREMAIFSYYENDIPYFSQPNRILTYSGGCFPDHHLGPAFLKDQYWDNPNCRPDGHNMSGRRNFLDHKSSRMGYEEALEHIRYHNQRRYPLQGDVEGLRNLTPKYSSAVNQSGSPFMYKGESVNHRMRTRQDCPSPLYEHDDKYVEGKHRRIFPRSAGDRDRLDCSYGWNAACDRREVEISGRDKRRRHSSLNSSENLSYIETQVNRRRNIKHHPFPCYSSEEPNASSQRDYIGAPGKKYGDAQGSIECSWKELHFECDQYGTDVSTFVSRKNVRYHPYHDYHMRRRDYQQSPNAYVMSECIKDDQCHDHFVGRRRRHHSELLHSWEDVFKPRQQDNIVSGSEEPSYHFKRISKNYEADDRLAFCRVTELKERETRGHNFKMLRKDKNKHFDGCRKSTQLHSHAQMHPRHQDSVDHLVVGRKCTLQSSIRRTTEAGEDTFYGRRELMERNEKDTANSETTFQTNEGKVDARLSDGNQQSKVSKNQQNEFGDVEEGQIITEEMKKHINVTAVQLETAPDGNGTAERLDDEKIREIMMKMERRRERFKEPITVEKTSCPLPESNVETAEARLERPARKRRWLGT